MFALLGCLALSGAARADALDDTLARFLTDKFPDSEKAIGELAAEAPPQGAAILEALSENRLLFDAGNRMSSPTGHGDGKVVDAKTGAVIANPASFKKVRVNNALRSAIEGALGSLTLANPDPEKRLAAAGEVFKIRDAKALPAIKAQLAKESDPRVAEALKLAVAAIVSASDEATSADRLQAIETLRARGDQDAQNLIDALDQKATDPEVKAAADSALASIRTRLLFWGAAQDMWYGLSASSVLLLAAIGLAITFGVMGVINMAHGEMVMLGAYATYVVQLLLPPALQSWSLAFAIPLAFLVAAAVGVLIERLVIRYLYTRPLETLLATWGVSLILQQTVRSIFGANNRQVSNPPFMSGRLPCRRPRDHDQPDVDHRAGDRRLRRPAARAARDSFRAADARRHPEPAHGGGHGHLDRAGSTCSPSRSARGSRALRASRCRRSTTSRRTSARATSSTASWSWCSAASATSGAPRSAR